MRETTRKVFIVTRAHRFSNEAVIAVTDTFDTAEQLITIAYPKAVRKELHAYMQGRSFLDDQIYIRDQNVATDNTSKTNIDEVYLVTSIYTDDPYDTESMVMIADSRETAEKEIEKAYSRAENATFVKIDDYTYSAVYANANEKTTAVRIRIKKIRVLRSIIEYNKPA